MTHPFHDHRREVLRLPREHGARSVRIFGSAARDDVTPNSDVDVLIHSYMGVGVDEAWSVLEKDLPLFEEPVNEMQTKLDDGAG